MKNGSKNSRLQTEISGGKILNSKWAIPSEPGTENWKNGVGNNTFLKLRLV